MVELQSLLPGFWTFFNSKNKDKIMGSGEFVKAFIVRRRFIGGMMTFGSAGLWGLAGFTSASEKPKKSSQQPKNRPRPMGQIMAAANQDDVALCMARCSANYDACCQGCANSGKGKVSRAICYSACMNSWVGCQTTCAALAAVQTTIAVGDWMRDHPEIVVGTVVVIGAVTFVVVTGGSGLALAPLLAL